jgi:hypothetical protein
VQGILVEQSRVAEQEKVSLQVNFEEEKVHMQQEREQLLAEQLEVKEAFNRALISVIGLEIKEKYQFMHQVEHLMEAI